MASKCTIQFDNNPLGVYYAGQTISGVAELITARPKTIRSIYISINGHSEVRWTENVYKQNAQGKRENAIETFSSTELYFTSEKYVFGSSGGSQLELIPGKYVYPFQATIPPNAPTSFNGTDGKITYEVVMVIDRVLRYNNTFKQEFTVISPYDLNLNPLHANPMETEERKVFFLSMCCGGKNPITIKARVPFSAYSPGQRIRFNVVLDNQSDVRCSDIKVRLMRKVTYTCHIPEIKTKWNEVKIAQVLLGEVVKKNRAEMNEYLEIPSTVPSSLENCSIIKIIYTLKFTVKLAGFYSDLDLVFPLTVGTLPLQASLVEEQNAVIVGQPGVTPVYKPMPPPTYQDDVTAKGKYQDKTFVPKYPVFSYQITAGTIRDPPGNLYPSMTPQAPVAPYPTSPIPHEFNETNGSGNTSQIGWKT
ncbi:arrestin domain-containing protein 3 [Episyrphus balteatus]|uniref:arrestin domain-containing protein 3 n=1 Tax=Episyrphus balteatus TaxID=286459 RepID=UPI002484E812|nr:arrestin domain-containing protein 3 [Episyrphus balteatus]